MIKKQMYLEGDRYTIEEDAHGWFDLKCNDVLVAKLVNEEECRRVIWVHFTNRGLDIPYIEEADFDSFV